MKQIKKILCLGLTTLLFAMTITPATASNVKVKVGGELIKFDVKPQIINGRTMVPLRKIFEALDATVEWNEDTKTVTATKDDTTISLTIDSPIMYVNGEAVTLDSPACLVDNRTLVPVRAISEGFNLKVEWNDNARTVRVRKPVSLLVEEIALGGTINKYEYDKNGNLIVGYEENTNGSWLKYRYDENDNLIRIEMSTGDWIKYEYDENGNRVYTEMSNGGWQKNVYDKNGNPILYEMSDDGWKTFEYDQYGNMIYFNNDLGEWKKYQYDENGNLLRYNYFNGAGGEYAYDENGNILYFLENNRERTEYIYDENGNKILEKYYDGYWEQNEEWRIIYEYDETGNLIYEEGDWGEWTKYQYDSNGNLIYEEDSNGYWAKYIVMEI